jgi:hypothetical protein
MKTKNNFLKWCKCTAMTLPVVAVMLTFVSCQKDGQLFDTAPDASFRVTPLKSGLRAGATPDTITFEDVDPTYLADSPYGNNLYGGPYTGFPDPVTGLWFLPTHTSDQGFASGGIAPSQWNDTTTAGYLNQCSVYYIDPATGDGGHNGSKTFAVHYGYRDTIWSTRWDGRTVIKLADSTKTCIFDHFYVINNTYATRSMEYSDAFAKKFTYKDKDWFKLIIDGLDKNGNVTRTVEFYLADFRTRTSPGIIKNWTYVDLKPLGKVTAIRFDMTSSDIGEYGLNTPAYFCFDDLVVQMLD